MSWFDAAKFSKYAKTALKQAQKNIDKVLDIQDESGDTENGSSASNSLSRLSGGTHVSTHEVATTGKDSKEKESDYFFNTFLDASWSGSTDAAVNDPQLDGQKGEPRDDEADGENLTEISSKEDLNKQLPSGPIQHLVSIANEPKNSQDHLFDIDLSETDNTDISYSYISNASEESTQNHTDAPKSVVDVISNSISPIKDVLTTFDVNIGYYCDVEEKLVDENPCNTLKSSLDFFPTDDGRDTKSDNLIENVTDGNNPQDANAKTDHAETSVEVIFPVLLTSKSNTLDESVNPTPESISERSENASAECPSSLVKEVSCVDDSVIEVHEAEIISPINTITVPGNNDVCSSANSFRIHSGQIEHEKCVDWLASFPSKPDVPPNTVGFNEEVNCNEVILHEPVKSCEGCSPLEVDKSSNDDPLETIMKQAESFLITSSGPSYDVVEDADINHDLLVNTLYSAADDEVQVNPKIENISVNSSNSYSGHSHEGHQLNKEIIKLKGDLKQLESVIEAREMKIVDLSRENISLQESISVYKNQIMQLELVNQDDDKEMEILREEFTTRIAECDSKCKAAIKERDGYKVKLIETEASLRQSTNEQISVLTNSLLEKEETIKDLLNEGEILAKKELEKNTHIKKLRVKLKDLTTKNTTLTDQVASLETEVQKLKDMIEKKETNQKQLEGEMKKLEGITDSQEDEVSNLKDELEDLEEKYKAIESTLKNTYSEINRLNLENCQKDSEIQDLFHDKEEKKQLEDRLKELEKTSKTGKEELLVQLEDLQVVNTRLEHQFSRREDELKKEIEDLHSRLEHAMFRNQELSQSVSAATKPLLRQIENLQSTFSAQSEGWELVEKSLNDRVVSMQDQLSLAVEKERAASEVAVEASSKLKAIKSQENVFRIEKTNLQIALDKETNRCKEIESEWKREKCNHETKLSKLKVVVQELEGDKRVLEEQLTAERVRYENDTLRMSTQITLQQQQQDTTTSRASSRQSSRTSSISGDIDTSTQKNVSDTPLERYLSRSSSIHDGLQKGTVTTTAASVEHLKSQLRSREGEVFVLQEQIKESEKRKASLAQELVNLSNQVEELEGCNIELTKLKEDHSDLSSRYNAVLQMYGEKAEEAEELKMDIQDVKNMYRQQIQELCGGPR